MEPKSRNKFSMCRLLKTRCRRNPRGAGILSRSDWAFSLILMRFDMLHFQRVWAHDVVAVTWSVNSRLLRVKESKQRASRFER